MILARVREGEEVLEVGDERSMARSGEHFGTDLPSRRVRDAQKD